MTVHQLRIPKEIKGKGGGKSGSQQSQPSIAADNIQSTAFARVIELLSEGPIVGLYNGAKSIFFDGTPLQNDDGSFNFQNVDWALRFGDPDQDWLQGFSDVESETSVGVEVKLDDGAVVRSTSTPDLDAIRVTLRWGRLLNQDTQGNISNTTVKFSIEYKHNLDSVWSPFAGSPFTLTGKNSSGFEQQYYQLVRPPGEMRTGPWQIRVTRITADHDSSTTVVDAFNWQSFTEVIESKFIYPDTAYIGLQLPAQSFNGGVPTRIYDVLGRIIRVPSNYDAETKTYSGIWDGSFKLAWTDNPAWCLLDLLTNDRYGLGLDDSRVDTAGLYTIAQYCDEMIDDNNGGLRARYTLNVVINTQSSAYDLINKIVSNFMTMVYYATGGIMFSQDAPRDIDMLVVPGNVVDGEFTYQDTSYADTANVIMMTWVNPELQDKGDIEIVQDVQDIVRRGPVSAQFDSFGKRNRSETRCAARWQLYTGFFNGSTVVYRAGLDHADMMPGMIVGIKDPVVTGNKTGGGRVVENFMNTIQLDRDVTLVDGLSYMLLVLHPDKTLGEYQIITGAGTTDTLSLNSAPPPACDGGVWALISGTEDVTPYRVVSRSAVDKTIFEITAVKYHGDKFDLIEKNGIIDVDIYSPLASQPVLAPASISVIETLDTSSAAVPQAGVMIGWPASLDPRVTRYALQYSKGDDDWSDVILTADLSKIINSIPSGPFMARVRAETAVGRFSPWTLTATLNLLGLAQSPEPPTNMLINVINDRATLSWTPSPSLNVASYEVRYSPLLSGAGWISSSVMKTGVVANNIDVPSLTGTYFVKAVTYLGTYSILAAQVSSTLASQTKINVVELLREDPTWPGAKTDVSVSAGILRLDTNDDGTYKEAGNYARASKFDLGGTYLCRVTPTLAAVGDKVTNVLANWESLTDQTVLSGVAHADWGATIMYRTTADDPEDPLAVWTDWATLTVGDYLFRGLDIRIDLSSVDPYLTPVVSQASILIDMPDRVEGGNDIAIPLEGLTVAFDPPFKSLKGLGVNMQGLLGSDVWVVSDKDEAGFVIQCFDSGGAPISRGSFDYVASGYGRVTS